MEKNQIPNAISQVIDEVNRIVDVEKQSELTQLKADNERLKAIKSISLYKVETLHFHELEEHHGYFRNLDNAIAKAKEVLIKEQADLEGMRKFDNGISDLYSEDFKEVPIEHRWIYWEMASKTKRIVVSETKIIIED
jgi:hypothetical protein